MSTARSPGGAPVATLGYLEPEPGLIAVTRPSPLAGPLVSFRTYSRQPVTRRKREMIPADKKDATYWIKREKNNVAARRSRQKRRLKDLMVEGHLLTLSKENAHLRAQVLTLQYNRSLCVDTGKVTFAQEDATSHDGVLPPSLPLQSVQGHSPALLHPGLWGNNPTCLGGVTQESAMHRIKIPCFSPARCAGVFNPILQGLSGTSVVSASEDGVGCSRSAEARMDVQRLLSSREDIRLSTAAPAQFLSPIPAFLSTPGTVRPASALHCPSHRWLLPPSSSSAASRPSDLTLWSSYLPPPAVYPSLPLQLPETRQGLGVDAHMEMEVKSQFSGVPARVSHVGLHLRPGGL